jgi:molybdenum cofactor synthesis domain-containing protein
VEAMHGAAVTALTMYDMLKPIDKSVEIGTIRLDSKQGGKTSFVNNERASLRCAVVVCSDTISSGQNSDKSGNAIISNLEKYGVVAEHFEVIPDDFDKIQQVMIRLRDAAFNLVIFTGGTGLSSRDNTPDAVAPLLDKEIPGIMEAARNYGQQKTPYAMLSRGVAGFAGKTLVITLPGSVKGVEESMEAIFPYVFHVFRVADGLRHS